MDGLSLTVLYNCQCCTDVERTVMCMPNVKLLDIDVSSLRMRSVPRNLAYVTFSYRTEDDRRPDKFASAAV